MVWDLDEMSFEAWVDFTFDHPVSEPRWYEEESWGYSGSCGKVLAFCTRLFHDPEFLLDRYDEAQLSQGFWFIPGLDGYLRAIWCAETPLAPREECVLSMENLFGKLFAKHPFGEAAYMWWDGVDSYRGGLCGGTSGDDRLVRMEEARLETVMLEVLGRILLGNASRECQRSALHGMGHIANRCDEKTEAEITRLIDRYLSEDVPKPLAEFAEICRHGFM